MAGSPPGGDADPAAVPFRQLLDRGESQSEPIGTATLSAEVQVEQGGQRLRGNSRSRVDDLRANEATRLHQSDGDTPVLRVAHVLERIADQVTEQAQVDARTA